MISSFGYRFSNALLILTSHLEQIENFIRAIPADQMESKEVRHALEVVKDFSKKVKDFSEKVESYAGHIFGQNLADYRLKDHASVTEMFEKSSDLGRLCGMLSYTSACLEKVAGITSQVWKPLETENLRLTVEGKLISYEELYKIIQGSKGLKQAANKLEELMEQKSKAEERPDVAVVKKKSRCIIL